MNLGIKTVKFSDILHQHILTWCIRPLEEKWVCKLVFFISVGSVGVLNAMYPPLFTSEARKKSSMVAKPKEREVRE